jgi:hypothetical protein
LPNVGLEGVSLKECPVHPRAPVLPLQGGARRGWARRSDVLNTLDAGAFTVALKSMRS